MKRLRSIINESEDFEGGISPDKFKDDLKSGRKTNYDKIHQHAQKHLTGDTSHIGPEEKDSIGTWTSPPGYKAINGHMRTGNGSPRTKKQSASLTKAVEGHELPASTWAYRGIHANHSETLNSLRIGDHFHSQGFSSTTLDPKRATHFAKGEDIMAMHLNKGTKALYVSHPKLNGWEAEREMLLAPNTHFIYKGSENIHAPEHDYEGRPTGTMKKYKLHHVEIIPHSNTSIAIDR